MTSTTPRTTSPRRRIATLEKRIASTTADAPARMPTLADTRDCNLTEAQFQWQVADLLERFGWRWAHHPDSRRLQGHPGIPDIQAVRAGRFLMIELKAARGRLRDEQREWLASLATVRGLESYVWKPSDLSEIAEVLR